MAIAKARKVVGRLERIALHRAVGKCSAEGTLGNTTVYVKNAVPYVGAECVARVSAPTDDQSGLRAQFITNRVPAHFKGFAPSSYLLIGVWNSSLLPTLDQMNQVYDPGHAGRVDLIRRHPDSTYQNPQMQVVLLTTGRPEVTALTAENAVERALSYMGDSARVVLTDRTSLQPIMDIARKNRVCPVLMQPIGSFPNAPQERDIVRWSTPDPRIIAAQFDESVSHYMSGK